MNVLKKRQRKKKKKMKSHKINWYKTQIQITKAFKQLHKRHTEEYAEWVKIDGRAFADAFFDWDSHACTEFSQNGGYCAFCGNIINGSPVDNENKDVDWEYYEGTYYPDAYELFGDAVY